ncbi:MAG TPA: HdeD family acid-resistance protein [Polyangia bacterium]|jgi:uncharacterized membrane protein HdeD (DUF308 family)
MRNETERAGEVNIAALTDRWWALALRGAAGVIFGVLTFVAPAASLFALVVLFGVYALVDGGFNLVMAYRDARGGRRWGVLVFEGIVSVAAGVVTLIWPGISALALLFVIASWAIVTGAFEIAAAIRLRKQIRHEWLLALSGALSVVFGVLLFLRPGAGALAVTVLIGAYAVVFGALLMGLGFRLRSWGRAHEEHPIAGGMPEPA